MSRGRPYLSTSSAADKTSEAAEANSLWLLVEALPQIVWVASATGQVLYYNRKWFDYTGRNGDPSEDWRSAIHPDDIEMAAQLWERSITTHQPVEFELRIRSASGDYQWFLTRASFVEHEGTTEWIGTSTNIDSQKKTQEALAFLDEASSVLGSSLDYERTLQRVAELAVPRMGDWCGVDILNEEGDLERLATAHVNPEKVKWALELQRLFPVQMEQATGVPQVLRTGRSEFYPVVTDEMLRAVAPEPERYEILREIGMSSAIIVPLAARNVVFGAVTFVSAEARRHYTDTDLKLAEELGRRAGLAIDNSWLYRKAQLEISDREQTAQALSESEERYRIVAETATDAIVTIDERSTILFANQATARIFGFAIEEIIGKPVTMLMPPGYAERHTSAVQRYLESGRRHIDWSGTQLPGRHKDGSIFPLEISFGEYIHRQHRTFTAIMRDVTERENVERRMRLSEARFRTMIEQSPLGIQVFDLEGNCIQVNHSWEELWSANRSDLEGYNVLHDPQLAEQGRDVYIRRAYAGEAVALPPMYYDPAKIGKPGRPRWIRAFAYPVKSDEKQVQEVALILEDVTERRLAEDELRRAKELAEANEEQLRNANHAKDRFLAILSHELRTPLTPVMATVQALQTEEFSPDVLQMLDMIQRNVELEARLIDDLLDLTRITKGKLKLNNESTDVHDLIRNVVEIYRDELRQNELSLSVTLRARESVTVGDPARIQQVFWNIVRNAIKFTPHGGKILIHSENTKNDEGKEVIRVEISDTGIGIEPDTLERIFDPFEQGEATGTSRYGGLGLGLAISRNLVNLHQGSLIAISPGRGQGSTFIVEFLTEKALHVPSTPTDTTSSKAEMADQGRTVLLVDDHIDTSLAVRLLLERQGYSVIVANSAGEAIETAKKRLFDLVISDIGLPDESGLLLLPKLRQIRDVPAIALSGFGTDEDVERSREAGFNEHITKPFNLAMLKQMIDRLLQKK